MTAEERKDITKHIEILEKGIERELKKHYTKEENRQKKIKDDSHLFEKNMKQVLAPMENINKYTGTYTSEIYGDINITIIGESVEENTTEEENNTENEVTEDDENAASN